MALICLQLSLLATPWLKKEANKAVLAYDITLTIAEPHAVTTVDQLTTPSRLCNLEGKRSRKSRRSSFLSEKNAQAHAAVWYALQRHSSSMLSYTEVAQVLQIKKKYTDYVFTAFCNFMATRVRLTLTEIEYCAVHYVPFIQILTA